MSKQLLKIPEYGLFTFATTSYALKAEKVLKAAEAEFMVIPTLREISSSCGLSVKFMPDKLEEYASQLINNQVTIEAAYQVRREGTRNKVKQVSFH